MEVLNPSTGEVIAEVPRGSAEDVERAVERGEVGVVRVEVEDAEGPHGAPARHGGRHRRERRGARAARVAERRQAVVGGEGRAARDVRLPALLRRRGAQPRGEVGGRVRRGLHVDDPARAARDRRRHLPVELPAVHGDLEDRAGARRRQRPDHQAGRADAAHAAPVRRARAGGDPGRACSRSSPATGSPRATRSCAIRTSGSSRSPATRRRGRSSPRTPRTRSSASTSSSAARRRWSCSTTPIRRPSPRRSRSAATSTPARTAPRPPGSS